MKKKNPLPSIIECIENERNEVAVRVVVIKLEAQRVFVNIDMVPDLLGSLMVNIGRWGSGGSRSRGSRKARWGPPIERLIHIERLVVKATHKRIDIVGGMGLRWASDIAGAVWGVRGCLRRRRRRLCRVIVRGWWRWPWGWVMLIVVVSSSATPRNTHMCDVVWCVLLSSLC